MELTGDCLVVGSGPAGLAACAALAEHAPDLRVVAIERGVGLDEREDAAAGLATGVGGAGLYADGKFSFRPSATRLWTISPTSDLAQAERWLGSLLDNVGWPLQLEGLEPQGYAERVEEFEKRYPSVYVPLPVRHAIIDELAGDHVRHGSALEGASWHGDRWAVSIGRRGLTDQENYSALVLAPGRFVNLVGESRGKLRRTVYRRAEYGVRFEQSSDDFAFRDHPSVDPKYVIRSDDRKSELRTFCVCREGVVGDSSVDWITAVSGRSDVEPTGRSNFGFLIRHLDENIGIDKWERLEARLRNLDQPIIESFSSFAGSSTSPLADLIGLDVRDLMLNALAKLGLLTSLERSETLVYGPSVEGVGYYIDVDDSLRGHGVPLWVAGDATGLFRGLVAALVSGYFCGLRVASVLENSGTEGRRTVRQDGASGGRNG